MSRVVILVGSGMLGHTLLRHLAENPGFDVYDTVRPIKKLAGWLPPDRAKKVHQNVDIQQIDNLVKVSRTYGLSAAIVAGIDLQDA